MKRYLYLITTIVLLLSISACEHKELCYDHAHAAFLKVVFDWKNAPQAEPATVSLYLFPKEGGEALRYEFTDHRGGTIRVPLGEYDAICLNSDTRNNTNKNIQRLETFEVCTHTTTLLSNLSPLNVRTDNAPRAKGTEEERIALAPEMLWTNRTTHIDLTAANTEQLIVLYPKQSVINLSIEIRNAKNLKHALGISGSLSGLAGGFLPGKEQRSNEAVTIPFEMMMHKDDDLVTGQLLSFGHCQSTPNKHLLTIYAILSDYSKWYYTFDITNQVQLASNQQHIQIILDDLPLPKPIVNGGGFQPTVNEWASIDININM